MSKRIFSLALCAALLLTMVSGLTLTAYAEETGYAEISFADGTYQYTNTSLGWTAFGKDDTDAGGTTNGVYEIPNNDGVFGAKMVKKARGFQVKVAKLDWINEETEMRMIVRYYVDSGQVTDEDRFNYWIGETQNDTLLYGAEMQKNTIATYEYTLRLDEVVELETLGHATFQLQDTYTFYLISVRFEPVPEEPGDNTALAAKVAEAELIDKTPYTAGSVKALEEALAAARATLANAEAPQKTIDKALAALNKAVTNLKEPGDNTALAAKVGEVNDMDKTPYTAGSVKALETALTAAKTTIANAEATQQEIDKALAALTKAVEGLVKRGDTTALAAAVTAANALDQTLYTDVSVKSLKAALIVAEAALDEPDVTQETVDSALAALGKAVENLEMRYRMGDANKDGQVTTADAALILQFAAELLSEANIQTVAADVNGDGKVTTADAALVLQYAAELITQFPVAG